MAIFDNELVDNVRQDGSLKGPKPVLGSVPGTQIDFNVGPTGGGGGGAIYGPSSRKGLSLKELSDLGSATPSPRGYGQSFTAFRQSELNANQRYPLYQRGVDLENIYGLQQPWYQQLGYGVVKLGANIVGTFAQSLTNIPNTISAIKNREFSELSGDPEGYEGTIDNWMRNMDNVLPNYFTRYEREHPFLTAIPFTTGSANWWGGKFLPNLGFMVGSVAGAVAQDVAIGAVTEGIGEIPLVANQIGKASLWLNKLFTGTNAAERITQTAIGLGKTEQQILNMKKLAELSAAAKMNSGFRYGMALYGASMTESGVESRNSYRGVKDQLTKDYIAQYGEEPGFEDAQKIEDYATNAMNTNFGINMALLVASNTLQFGNLFRSMTSAKGAVQELEGLGRVGLKEGSLDVFEKKTAQSFLGKVWDSVKPTASNIFREGVFEEGGQFAAERGTYDYYTRKYKSDKYKEDWDNVDELIKSTTFGMNEQFGSQEGIENMLIGAVTGLLVGKAQNIYEKRKGIDDDSKLAKSINILNRFGVTSTLQNNYDNTVTQLGIAKDMQDAVRANDVFRYKNLKEDAFFTYVQSRLPSKMHDVTIMQLEMLKDLPKEEFQQMFQLDFNETNKATVSQYVDALIEKANDIKKTTDAINNVFVNPFQNNPDASDLEGLIESDNYNTFEKYKTDLSYYATIAPNVNSRLSSIQQSVDTIVPGVTNDLLAQLTSNDGLKGLSEFYEQRAKELNESITEFTTPLDKKNLRDQIKALRTRSERISASLKSNKIDSKLFENLLNFEINGRDVKLENVVPIEQVDQLLEYGTDINRLNERKNIASKAYDALSTKEGFQKYFEQESEITADKDKDVEEKEKGKETIVPAKPLEFVNKAGATEIPQIDREYQLDIKPTAKVNKIADDRYEVVSPLGESTFYDNKEDADQAADDMNEDIKDLQKVKVLEINDDGTVKVEDLAGNIQNIDPKQMSGYERIQSAQEKLVEKKEELIRQQDELEKNSGSVTTIDSSQEFGEREPAKREVSQLFTGGITESETYNDPTKSAAHVVRSRRFLNNVKNNKNRANVKAILVTPNQEAGLGLTGLAALSYKVDTTKMTEAELNAFNEQIRKPDTGFIAQVFVVQKGNKLFFADEAGNPMNEVGTQVDLNKVVFQTMPTPALYDSENKPKFRAGQEAEAKAYSEAWAKYREQLMSAPATAFTIYDFRISRGIAIVKDVPAVDENGAPILNSEGKPLMTFERNHVGEVLVPEDKVGNKGVIVISITGEIVHNGLPVNVLRGTPVLQYGDTLQVLNNRKFTKAEAKTIFRLLSELSKGFALNSNLEESYTNFLQNVLHWKQGKSPSKNQVYINPDSMELRIAGKDIPLSEVNEREAEIMEELQKTFSNVNNKTIFSDYPFTEYFIDDNDQIASREWSSYNSYLLSASYPDGSKRSVKDTPLFTSVSKPTTAIPYSYMQKYAVLEGLELDVQYTAPAQQAETAGIPTVDGYVLDNKTPGVFPLRKEFGDFEFTAGVEPNGSVSVELVDSQLTRDTVGRIAKNKELINNSIVPQLKQLGIYDPVRDAAKTDEEIAGDYIALIAATSLEKKLKEKPAATETAATFTPTTPYGTPAGEEVTTAVTAAPVSDVEAKKADIERRRQEELKPFKNLSFEEALSIINKGEAPKITFSFAGREDSNSYPEKPIVKEGNNYRIITARYNVLIDSDFNIISTTSKEGKTYVYPSDKIGESTVEINSPVLNQNTVFNNKKSAEINAKYDAELAALEEAKPTETYKGIEVIDSSSIKAATGEPGAAQYNRTENKILVNRELLQKKFDEKAWTKPRKQKDGSSATALPADAFSTYDAWEKFVIEHEFQHSELSYEQSGAKNIGEYEDIINRRALGEEAKPAAQPVVTPTPSVEERPIEYGEVFSTGTTLGLNDLFGNVPKSFPDFNRSPGGKEFKQFIIGNKKIFTIVDSSISDAAGRGGYITTSIMVDKNSPTTLDDVKADLEAIHARTLSGVESDRKINKAKVAAALTGVRWASRPSATPAAQPYDNKGTTGPSTDFRVIAKGEKKEDKIDDLDIAEFKKWHAEKVPSIPYEILENIVRRNPDITAWGVFENGVAKFYRSATRGTEYHEIGEAIWKGFLSPGERQDLLNEFKSQSGTFKDRASGRNIEYAAATDTQAKERILDDFADFRVGKLPARNLKELILRFFRAIINFFKNFNTKPTLKQQLFEAIELGKFKESVLPDTVKNEAAAYREIEGLSEQQAQKFVEDMTARVAGIVFLKAKKFLYSPRKLTSKQIFGEIEEMYLREGDTPGWNGVNKRTKLGDGRWEALVQRTKEKLRTLGVTFNEDGIIKLNGEDTNKNDYAPEAFTVDIKKGASFDVKLRDCLTPVV